MNKIKTDIFGNIPKIGDIVVFNPPKHKGLIWGKVIGLSRIGNPILDFSETDHKNYIIKNRYKNIYSPKTEFVIIK
jgi:hypothetical protein